jgi:hypothetical protein
MANVRGALLGVVVSGWGQSLGRVPEHRAPVHLVVAAPACERSMRSVINVHVIIFF